MKKTYIHALLVVLATVISACGLNDTTDLTSETKAPQLSTSWSTVPADLLQTAENIGAELELWQGAGAITGSHFDGGAEWLNGPFNYSGYQFHVADVTGDGRADVVGVYPFDERVVVWTSRI